MAKPKIGKWISKDDESVHIYKDQYYKVLEIDRHWAIFINGKACEDSALCTNFEFPDTVPLTWSGETTEHTTKGKVYKVVIDEVLDPNTFSGTFICDQGKVDYGSYFISPNSDTDDFHFLESLKTKKPKVYLAGPDVFRTDAKEYFDFVKKLGEGLRLELLSPFDNENHDSINVPHSIYEANIKMIQECDLILANITRFRGPSADPGTVFEMGYAAALKKPIIAYGSDNEVYKLHASPFLAHPYYNAEDFELTDNLMIIMSSDSTHDSLIDALKEVHQKFVKQ